MTKAARLLVVSGVLAAGLCVPGAVASAAPAPDNCGALPGDYLTLLGLAQTYTGPYSHGGEDNGTMTLVINPDRNTRALTDGGTTGGRETYSSYLLDAAAGSAVLAFDTPDGVAVASPQCAPGTAKVSAIKGYVGGDHKNTFVISAQFLLANQ
ncbi:hypothetical protein K7B10_00210 [Streptomyces flavotricini]|uniref:Secreted protein n=1 Tax=Streptomyces flavotricini TaxID=66888 RepID=A0ABS8DX51_9ACTN|nr:hypothetical protein [Streptomyces flavotricini]MCC0093257.1 hypothetical protein [Streptomyces flavotricini]